MPNEGERARSGRVRTSCALAAMATMVLSLGFFLLGPQGEELALARLHGNHDHRQLSGTSDDNDPVSRETNHVHAGETAIHARNRTRVNVVAELLTGPAHHAGGATSAPVGMQGWQVALVCLLVAAFAGVMIAASRSLGSHSRRLPSPKAARPPQVVQERSRQNSCGPVRTATSGEGSRQHSFGLVCTPASGEGSRQHSFGPVRAGASGDSCGQAGDRGPSHQRAVVAPVALPSHAQRVPIASRVVQLGGQHDACVALTHDGQVFTWRVGEARRPLTMPPSAKSTVSVGTQASAEPPATWPRSARPPSPAQRMQAHETAAAGHGAPAPLADQLPLTPPLVSAPAEVAGSASSPQQHELPDEPPVFSDARSEPPPSHTPMEPGTPPLAVTGSGGDEGQLSSSDDELPESGPAGELTPREPRTPEPTPSTKKPPTWERDEHPSSSESQPAFELPPSVVAAEGGERPSCSPPSPPVLASPTSPQRLVLDGLPRLAHSGWQRDERGRWIRRDPNSDRMLMAAQGPERPRVLITSRSGSPGASGSRRASRPGSPGGCSNRKGSRARGGSFSGAAGQPQAADQHAPAQKSEHAGGEQSRAGAAAAQRPAKGATGSVNSRLKARMAKAGAEYAALKAGTAKSANRAAAPAKKGASTPTPAGGGNGTVTNGPML